MKKILYTIIAILCFSPLVVSAAGSITVSKSSISLNVGGSSSFTINANNAAGRVDISTSNSSVASISESSVWLDNSSATINVKANGEGSATITVSVKDASTYDEEELHNTYTISVNVKTPAPEHPKEPSTSSNTTLSSISVEGHQLQTSDNTNYYLVVDNSVTSVNVSAKVEDSKSTLTGIGAHSIVDGNNKIELVVTAESGAKKTYIIHVSKKKDKYYVEDLSTALSLEQDVNIILKDGDVLNSDSLNLIKNSNKNVTFTKYDDNSNKLYSIIVEGKNISEANEVGTDISVSTDNSTYNKMFDFEEGYYFKLDGENELPSNTKVRYYLGDKYDSDSKFQVYYYDSEEEYTVLIADNLSYKDGYVEFIADKGNNYFVKTRSSVNNDKIIDEDVSKKIEAPVEKKDKLNIFMIVAIAEFLLIILLIILFVVKKKKKNKEVSEEKNLMN